MGSITIRRNSAVLLALALGTAACARPHVSPLAPPPYRSEIPASYDATWRALVRTLATQNVSLRAIARDSGVIASDNILTPIGLYADCGRIGDDRVEGDALVSFTLFASPSGGQTSLQVNSKMRTVAHRAGASGKLRGAPIYQCASTGRFELNLFDAVRQQVRE